MKIAKEFRWEMGHRLPDHFGLCKNIHGHSYKMIVEFEGELDKNQMVIDYYDVEKIINPIIEKLDHAFMINKEDKIAHLMADQEILPDNFRQGIPSA